MKPYSTDLRQKLIDAYNNGEGSQRQLAKREACEFNFCSEPTEAQSVYVGQLKQSHTLEGNHPN
ncbi:hypothetical protein G7B40_035780 [Aetokthonos hydrillicola Thurmond2011]|jgi:transposase|uniref:Uncharacterized protein n=1 Tax=Aetokthonos hydrillicola Thurmond2011 TaxID=2712845 RepID=A0AAP5IGZ8_9CYAN|nr:hypothetical protein [Aetokthonos hydrillicola]MBW4586415.1 hypothetical protein [Aetokthonos hydrillicola CCALA 1050]MDR9899878.1 hypothetical protein [Aetokthonos hydrillicola Thurmond2011]